MHPTHDAERMDARIDHGCHHKLAGRSDRISTRTAARLTENTCEILPVTGASMSSTLGSFWSRTVAFSMIQRAWSSRILPSWKK